jgi:type I restriction enzyme S subunit
MEALVPFTKKIKNYEIDKYNEGVKFRNGDVLIAKITPSLENGKTAFVDILEDGEIGFGSTEFIVLRGKENETDKHFLYYFAVSQVFREVAIKSMTGSSGRQRVQKEVVFNHEFLLPPFEEQKAIAGVLSALDDKIDLLHRQNKTLEQMAETLFRKWFIEDAQDDWEEVKLKDIYIFEKGFEPGSDNYLEEAEYNTVRFIRVGDLLEDKGKVFIKKEIAKVLCDTKDLLMSFDGTVGRINFGIEGAFSSGIRKIYSLNPIFDNLGLKYLIFKSKDIQDLIHSYSSGTVILHASSSIDYLTFQFPKDEKYIKDFNKIIDPIFKKILNNKLQIRKLENLRDTLLPKLITGEWRVRVCEI